MPDSVAHAEAGSEAFWISGLWPFLSHVHFTVSPDVLQHKDSTKHIRSSYRCVFNLDAYLHRI